MGGGEGHLPTGGRREGVLSGHEGEMINVLAAFAVRSCRMGCRNGRTQRPMGAPRASSSFPPRSFVRSLCDVGTGRTARKAGHPAPRARKFHHKQNAYMHCAKRRAHLGVVLIVLTLLNRENGDSILDTRTWPEINTVGGGLSLRRSTQVDTRVDAGARRVGLTTGPVNCLSPIPHANSRGVGL